MKLFQKLTKKNKDIIEQLYLKLNSKLASNKLTSKLTTSQLRIAAFTIPIVAVLIILFPPLSIQDGSLIWANWTGLSEDVDVSIISGEIEQNGNLLSLKHIIIEQPVSGTTFVDWINSLGAPFALTVLGFWFQKEQEKRAEEQAELEKQIAENNLCEEALQGYFDRLSELLLDRKLTTLTENDPVQEVALNVIRARTLSILRRLGKDREKKGNIVRFLIDSELMNKLNLSGADLSNADLIGTNLENTDLRGANLENVDLRNADLRGARLENANLANANLAGAILENVDLKEANLTGTNLQSARLSNANLRNTQLQNTNLITARLGNVNLRNAHLENANLTGARLENANLMSANLMGAILEGANFLNANLGDAKLGKANLKEANLAGADLGGTDLRGAINLTLDQVNAGNNVTEALCQWDSQGELISVA